MNVVFTGTFRIDGEQIVRSLLEEMCEAKGWTVQKKVNSFTNYVVQSMHGGQNTIKTRDAIMHGAKIITPEDFWALAKIDKGIG